MRRVFSGRLQGPSQSRASDRRAYLKTLHSLLRTVDLSGIDFRCVQFAEGLTRYTSAIHCKVLRTHIDLITMEWLVLSRLRKHWRRSVRGIAYRKPHSRIAGDAQIYSPTIDIGCYKKLRLVWLVV